MLAMIWRLLATRWLQENVLLLEEAGKRPLGSAPLGDVLDGEEEGRVQVTFVENLAGVEQHRAPADPGEGFLDLEPVLDAILGHDPL